jgi:superfamily II DNA or RNA helicase
MEDDTIELNKVNEVYFKVKCTLVQMRELFEHFSCYIPNHFYHPKVKAKLWSGKISFFDMRTFTFPIGLLPMFMEFIYKFSYTYKFNFDVNELSSIISQEDLDMFYGMLFQDKKYYPRDYQNAAIYKMLSNKRGTVLSATGSGKSLIVYVVTRFLQLQNKKTLIIVPTVSLVEQLYSDFASYGFGDLRYNCNKLYAKPGSNINIDFDKPILISTWQSLYKRPQSFFEKYDMVICDEAHSAKGHSIKLILEKCINAKYRFGLTGTLQAEKSDLYNIFGYLGPKIYELKSKELQDKGILSKIQIVNLFLKYPEQVIDRVKNRDYNGEIEEILSYTNRNIALQFILDNTPKEENTLLLCHRIEHVHSTVSYIKEKYPEKSVFVIYGETGAEDRENIRNLIEKKSGCILVATYQTMGTGVNITKIHQIIFYASYKSKIKVLQGIGRGLRLNPTKSKLILWDCIDDCSRVRRTGTIYKNYVFLHWEERQQYYEQAGFPTINKSIQI